MNRVHIEFKRVQKWLFEVPRLRAMVGANALLGETVRVELPKLARETGRWALAPSADNYPPADPGDPLKADDDPALDARDGILSRDGGHFEAQFSSGAGVFATEAEELLRQRLPGLPFRISIDGSERQKCRVHLSTELPVLAPCEWTGRGLSSQPVQQGNELATVSLDVAARHDAAKRVGERRTRDLASLLCATTKLKELAQPQTLEDLVGLGYMALIHADGNGVGGAAPTLESDRAAFFHRNRVLLRCALQKAIDTICEGVTENAPLVPLMLGGDDLLVVCRAAVALPFVVTLCQALEELQRHDDSSFKLTLGAGVVIAKYSIPIHRLHEVAEQLAGSAKRRFRGFGESERRSVVDWAVYSTSWVEDPEEVRTRDWLRGAEQGRRVLSQRPVDVLGDGLESLQGLLSGAQVLATAPRSQLRYLVEQLSRGKSLSDLAFAELVQEARTALEQAGLTQIWSSGTPCSTPLLDLVEVAEIARLGRANSAPSGKEVADAYA